VKIFEKVFSSNFENNLECNGKKYLLLFIICTSIEDLRAYKSNNLQKKKKKKKKKNRDFGGRNFLKN